ncbi:MAG: hypothetical protein MUE81_22020 [Thermoflexibacter sp.]|nr:hypothetical protein [Thermoflexibacter sp.]
MEKVTINHLSKENCWVFESETPKDKCLGAGGKTVERSILYLKDDRLYVLMIELKSQVKDCNKLRKKVKDKFECSIARIAIFLASNTRFLIQKDIQLYPVGILCFNKDEYDTAQGGTSDICKNFTQFKNNGKVNNGFNIEIQPVTLNTLRIPILFFQNPIFQENNDATSSQFDLNFVEIMNELLLENKFPLIFAVQK